MLAVAVLSATDVRVDGAPAPGWSASPAAFARASQSKPTANFDEAKVGSYTLTDPLVAADGSRVTRETWPQRRAELLKLFGDEMFGHAPVGRPENLAFRVVEEDPHALDGKATRKLVEISFDTPHAGRFKFPVQLYLPNDGQRDRCRRSCCCNSRGSPIRRRRGSSSAAGAWRFSTARKLAADDAKTFREGVINAFSGDGELAPDAWQAFGAWAWGGESRAGLSGNRPGRRREARRRRRLLADGEDRALGRGERRAVRGRDLERVRCRRGRALESQLRRDDRGPQRPLPALVLRRTIGSTTAARATCRSTSTCCWRSSPRGRSTSAAPTKISGPTRAASSWPASRRRPSTSCSASPAWAPTKCRRSNSPWRPAGSATTSAAAAHDFTDYDWQRYLDFLDRQLPANGRLRRPQ